MTPQLRVLVLIQGALGERLTGPEIRGWEIVRSFSASHAVTVVAPVAEEHLREGIRVLPRTRRRVVAELLRHDVVVGPVIPPYALTALAGRRCLRVADLYDPVDLELGTLDGVRARRAAALRRAGRRLQLRWADLVLCANERQLERVRDDLADLAGRDKAPLALVVPMGLPEPPPGTNGHPLRDRFGPIGREDPVVLWWGSVWRWLDAGTAIEAVGRLARTRPDLRLVVTAGKPPNAATDRLNTVEEARDLAARAGLLDRHVFFLDEWVPFDQRHAFLSDADVGLTLHADTPEASLAARARYMDYVWASLPCVLAAGDEVADEMAVAGAARLVPPRDVAATADALGALLGDAPALRTARRACQDLARCYRWSSLLEPLVSRVESLERRAYAPAEVLRVAAGAGGYYARRLAA
jgi:glycosyltransferase involved in cell wall biosynthesis